MTTAEKRRLRTLSRKWAMRRATLAEMREAMRLERKAARP